MQNNPLVSRERVVSVETQPRTSEARITVLQQTLTHVNVCYISFAQEKKKHGYFYFLSSTKWLYLYFNQREHVIIGCCLHFYYIYIFLNNIIYCILQVFD